MDGSNNSAKSYVLSGPLRSSELVQPLLQFPHSCRCQVCVELSAGTMQREGSALTRLP